MPLDRLHLCDQPASKTLLRPDQALFQIESLVDGCTFCLAERSLTFQLT
jgi:hypothetical protein